MSRNEMKLNLMRSHLTDLTTSFARVPNSLFCLFEPRMSLVASLTPRALFLVRIVFTVALKRAVLSMLISEQKPAAISDENDKVQLSNHALFTVKYFVATQNSVK